MESSKLMINKLILLRHLKVLESDEKRMESFKKALCQLKPPPAGGLIRMEDLKDKSIQEIVDFIFRCHTERHGASTIQKVLKEINENQIRLAIDKELSNAKKNSKIMETKIDEAFQSFNNMETEKTEAVQCSKNMETEKAEVIQCRKNMETEKNEASTSKSYMKVPSMGSKDVILNDDSVSSSEPPAKIIRQQDRDFPGESHNTEQNVDKMRGPSPSRKEPKQGTSQSIQKNVNKNGGPRPVQKQGHSQSEKALPSSEQEELKNRMVKCLEALTKDKREKFEIVLCGMGSPIKKGEIRMEDIKDKSARDVADLIISRRTMRHAQATFKNVLEEMQENQLKSEFMKSSRNLPNKEKP